jgi:Flp pilus assembly pilin Flp
MGSDQARTGCWDRQGDSGATALEYAMLASLVAVVIAGAVTLFGAAVVGLFASMPAGL